MVKALDKALKECSEQLKTAEVRITHGLRTNKEQDDLYAIGRTVKGKSVTNAKGGQSVHNYGLAVDICLIIKNVVYYDLKIDSDYDGTADWMEAVKIFKNNGFTWGGDWLKFKDNPHFEYANHLYKNGWRDLIKLKKDSNGFVIF